MPGPSYSYQDFRARAEAGHSQERRVARLLRHWGHDVPDPVLSLRAEDDLAAIGGFTRTQRDLIVGELYLEVKSRTFPFTSRADYPYPTAMLETVGGWEAKARKPDLYVLVSQATGGILAVDARDMTRFQIQSGTDRRRNLREQWYFADRSLLRPHTWLEGFLAAHAAVASH